MNSPVLGQCLFLVLCATAYNVAVDEAAIDAVVHAGLRCYKTSGLALAVVHNGSVVFSKGYGVSDMETRANVTDTTLFGIASLTKAFTTTLLSKVLAEDGRFSINTNIYRILGRSKFNNTLRSIYATVEDLMAHRMGIPRNSYIRLDNHLTRDNLLRRMKYLKSRGSFRDSFYYNDLMYGLLALMTEELSGTTWEEQMTRDIFAPLDMTSSTFGTRVNFSSPEVAKPYVLEAGQLTRASAEFIRHWAQIGGSGSVMSSAKDMSKWMLFHLSGGKNSQGVQVVAKDLLTDTYRPRNSLSSSTINKYFSRPDTPVTMSNDGYGLGWKTGYYRGLPILQHSGTTFGYGAFLTLVPDEHLGVFIAMTGTDPGYKFRGALTTYLTDVFLGENPWINSTTICTFPAPWHVRASRAGSRRSEVRRTRRRTPRNRGLRTQLPLVSYTGTFRNEAYGNLDVYYDTSSGQLRATYGIGHWVLVARGGDTFMGTWRGPPPSLKFYFRFLTSGDDVYGLIPSFEKDSPQLFFRIGHRNIIVG